MYYSFIAYCTPVNDENLTEIDLLFSFYVVTDDYSLLCAKSVEGLYCKRPIQCLASSKILTPHPLTARRVCTLPPLVRGRTHSLGGKGLGGQYFGRRRTLLCTLYIRKYFVEHRFVPSLSHIHSNAPIPTSSSSSFHQLMHWQHFVLSWAQHPVEEYCRIISLYTVNTIHMSW